MRFVGDGSVAPLDALVHRHLREVWHYLRVCGCSRECADDLTQEVFLVAMRKGVDPEPEATARLYLRRTARFVYLQHRRRVARDRWDPESAAWLDAVDEQCDARSDSRLDAWVGALRRCRAALRGRRARAVQMFYGEAASRRQVAAALLMTENGVKALLQRVRRDLRQCVERAMSNA